MFLFFFFCKQKTAYEMRISDWSSDVCSSDLFGVIARTAADGVDAQALEADLMFLLRLWDDIVAQARSAPAGALVHGDLPLSMRILRDLLGTNVERKIGRAHV